MALYKKYLVLRNSKPQDLYRPQGFKAVGQTNAILLTWDLAPASANITDIVIEAKGEFQNEFTELASVSFGNFSLTDTSFSHSGLGERELFSYRLRYYTAQGNSVSGIKTARTLESQGGGYLGFGTGKILAAFIDESESNILRIQYNEDVTTTNHKCIWLKDSSCPRPTLEYVSGNGTKIHKYRLADHFIPGYSPTVQLFPQLGDAQSNSGRVPPQSVSVTVTVISYNGSGTIRYVLGGQNVQTQINNSQAGDYVLMERNNSFTGNLNFPRNGSQNAYITLGAFGDGAKPVITNSSGSSTIVINRSYVAVSGLDVRHTGTQKGIDFNNNVVASIASGCTLIGNNNAVENQASYAGIHSPKGTGLQNWYIFDCDITGFRFGVRTSGFPYQPGTQIVQGGLLHGIYVKSTTHKDGMNIQRGEYNGLTIRFCEVTDFYEDGIDTYASEDVEIFACEVHHSKDGGSGNGIKAGGITGDSAASQGEAPNHQGRNVNVRYCYVHDVSGYGINNNTNKAGTFEGNLVENCGAAGIALSCNQYTPENNVRIELYNIRHNTVWNCARGVNVYNCYGGTVNVENNILYGTAGAIDSSGSTVVRGGNNVLLINASADYSGTNDITGLNASDVFTDHLNGNYTLKDNPAVVDQGRTISSYTQDAYGLPITNQNDPGCFERPPTVSGGLQPTTLHLLGDSLTDVTTPTQEGYGAQIAQYFGPKLTVLNHGRGGSSSVSYYETRYQNIKDQILAGHYVFIMFGHNDQHSGTVATTEAEFQAQLELYNTEIAAKGAIPIFLTPFERFQFSGGNIAPSHGNYDDIVRTVASAKVRVMLDIQDISADTYDNLGQSDTRLKFADETRPTDPTHFGLGKAYRGALMVISQLNASTSPLKNYVSDARKDFVWNPLWTVAQIP